MQTKSQKPKKDGMKPRSKRISTTGNSAEKTMESRPEILEKFRSRHTLESLQRIDREHRTHRFLAAQQWTRNQIEARRLELPRIADNIRREVIDGNRAGVQEWAAVKTIVLAEIAELELLNEELDYCYTPGKIEAELARRAFKQNRLQTEREQRIEAVNATGYGR